MNNGMIAEIINYRSCSDIDVKFQDGTILKNRTYRNFKKGTMVTTRMKCNRVGEKNHMNNGLMATIIAYRNVRDIDVEFEDGTLIKNMQYYSFQHGRIKHPTLSTRSYKGILFHIPINGIAYQLQQSSNGLPTTYFKYVHPETKEHCIGTVSDIHQVALDCEQIQEPQLSVFE